VEHAKIFLALLCKNVMTATYFVRISIVLVIALRLLIHKLDLDQRPVA